MKSEWLKAGAVALGLLVLSTATFAHHGAAGYGLTTTTLQGTVTRFDWKNPHALIHFDVENGESEIEKWTAETAGLVILVRAGWSKTTLKPGDRVNIAGRRAKNGTYSMLLQRVALPTGQTLNNFVPRS